MADRRVPVVTERDQDERNRKSLGQRRINFIWEATQAFIAGSVVSTTLWVNGSVALAKEPATIANQAASSALMQLNVMAALVTGFYFGRTNHEKSSGGNSALGAR